MTNNTNIPAGYKNSPVGIIPNEWEVKKVDDIFNFISTLSYSRECLVQRDDDNGIYYIHYGDIHSLFNSEILDLNSNKKIPCLKDELNSDKINFLNEGDLILADASEDYEGIGKSIEIKNIGNKKITGGLHTLVLRDKSQKTVNGFRTYIFNNSIVHKSIRRIATGISVFGISKGELSKIWLPLPPLPEQKRIAEVLSTWDAAIENLNQTLTLVRQRKKALMQQLLTGKKRLNGFKGEWKEVRLGDVFSEIKVINDRLNEHPIMTISSKLGLVSQEDKFDKVIAGNSIHNYTMLRKGDFAYNKGNSKTYPMGCIYQLDKCNTALVPFVYICFSPTDCVESSFYKQWFLNHGLDRQLKRIITSGARGDGLLNVNKNDFFNLKIILPEKTEQTAISHVLLAADKEIALLEAKLLRLREQKKGLMQVLLTGKKRLNPACDGQV